MGFPNHISPCKDLARKKIVTASGPGISPPGQNIWQYLPSASFTNLWPYVVLKRQTILSVPNLFKSSFPFATKVGETTGFQKLVEWNPRQKK